MISYKLLNKNRTPAYFTDINDHQIHYLSGKTYGVKGKLTESWGITYFTLNDQEALNQIKKMYLVVEVKILGKIDTSSSNVYQKTPNFITACAGSYELFVTDKIKILN